MDGGPEKIAADGPCFLGDPSEITASPSNPRMTHFIILTAEADIVLMYPFTPTKGADGNDQILSILICE